MSGSAIESLAAALASGRTTCHGVTAPLAALIAGRTAETTIVITPTEDAAIAVADDARLFADAAPLHVPANASHPYAEISGDRSDIGARMAALYRLARAGAQPPAISVSVQSLARRVVPRAELAARSRTLITGEQVDRDMLAAFLLDAGYRRLPVVDDPGTFAVRGGVVDLFPPLAAQPVRLELFGDEIESLRSFDPETQRTLRALERVEIHPAREIVRTGADSLKLKILAAADAASQPSKVTRKLLERIENGDDFVGIEILTPAFHERLDPLWTYLPPAAPIIVIDPDACVETAADLLDEAERRYADRLDEHRIAFSPADHYVGATELEGFVSARERALLCPRLELATAGSADDSVRVAVGDNRALAHALDRARHTAGEVASPLLETLGRWRADGWRVALVSASENRATRVAGLLEHSGVDVERTDLPLRIDDIAPGGAVALYRGHISAGFQLASDRVAVITDADIFGERRVSASRQRRAADRARAALLGAVADFAQLGEGDYLVHQTHGVGRYRGLAKLAVGDVAIDFLHVEYRGGTLYLPVYRIGEVQRYVGAEGHKVRLDKLGGQSWERTRRRVRRDVAALAEGLLQLYAQRAALPGRAFPPADAMFREFEATFEFEETPDQARAIEAVLADMEEPRPMDRLVCGDVGYGKTEVALRAALKASLGGAQVAMLAPTTVLVEQHFQTMTRRFAEWPMQIARLSRFQRRADQVAVVRGLADGSIDLVVGTHRLLSKDVRFKDLGLIVIDEEQRFGVVHKERLKSLRTQVDVLTLTATPIPRTLHLAMSGLRELSIIATPPADRRSIRTFLARAEDGVLREGIRRELARGGQVFFVVPRIAAPAGARSLGIDEWAEHLTALIPEARVAFAHGQMPTEALERAMVDFVGGELDVLVSTTIVESGLDIGRANTMFIADADRFGLAQLYQLRGRIGRAKERAYCYLMIPARGAITEEARRRLETLQRFTDLGAGFTIASHDLEIRGAGELLGSKQSGFIAAVGFDAYTTMLQEAVAELRGEAINRATDPELTVEVPGYIPDDYVPEPGQRLVFYKRLSGADDEDEIEDLIAELGDRYGPVPGETLLLAELMALKALARELGALALDLSSRRLMLTLSEKTRLAPERVAALVSSGSRYRLTPDMRLEARFDAAEAQCPTAAAKRCLLELRACVTPAEDAPSAEPNDRN